MRSALLIVKEMKKMISALALCLSSYAVAGVVTEVDPLGAMPEGTTVVWSPLFQATWDAMNAEIGGKALKIDPPNELMARLDAFVWDAESVMPEHGWKVWGGKATPDFLKRVNAEAKEMTGEEDGPFTLGTIDPHTVACFGLLDREVEFEKEFRQSMKTPLDFKVGNTVSRVAFFGTRGALSGYYEKEVRILHHENDWHALEISCKGIDDKVIVYLPLEPQNFGEACGIIRGLMKGDGSLLRGGDDLRIPYLSLDVTEDLTGRLGGGRFHGTAGDPWRIVRAEQVTAFELFEKGAKVRVETSLGADPFGVPPPPPVPRHFIHDRPFFVFLWREKAEWPYLGVWVGDDSALRKF